MEEWVPATRTLAAVMAQTKAGVLILAEYMEDGIVLMIQPKGLMMWVQAQAVLGPTVARPVQPALKVL
jgi:hypothetical protein